MFINKRRRHTKNNFSKTFKFLNLKYFLFYKYICKMYILADIKRNFISRFIQEQRRLLIFSDTKKLLQFYVKDFRFQLVSYRQSDSQRSSAPKNLNLLEQNHIQIKIKTVFLLTCLPLKSLLASSPFIVVPIEGRGGGATINHVCIRRISGLTCRCQITLNKQISHDGLDLRKGIRLKETNKRKEYFSIPTKSIYYTIYEHP